jgi:hypothetical protein
MAVATAPRFLSSWASTIVPTAARLGLALSSWSRDQQDHLDQLVEPDASARRDGHERRVATVLLDDDAGLGQLGLDPVGVRVGLVDLVEGDDDRDLGRLRVADRLERLGHDAVVGRDDDDRDVGHLRARPHGGERLVARRVEEDDALAVVGDLTRTDVLGDAAALAGRDLGRADRVEEARLAMVDVAHHRDDGRARLKVSRVVVLEQHFLRRRGRRALLVAVGTGAVRGRRRLATS